MIRTLTIAVVSLGLTHSIVAEDEPDFGTFKLDVVGLVRDQVEKPGAAELSVQRLGYRYHFESDANRNAFLKSPEAYEVQLGGACGKMGELSGRGQPDRYWVHEGRLYVFASDSCRAAFQQNPMRHLDHDDPAPRGSADARKEGGKLLDLAAGWSGLDKLEPGSGIEMVYESTYDSGGKTLPAQMTTVVRPNGDYLSRDTYDGQGYANEIRGSRIIEIDPKNQVQDHVPSWRRAVERARNRNLAYVLLHRRAASSSALLVNSDSGIAEVAAHTDGTLSTLWIDENSGKVMAFETKGRGAGGAIGKVKRIYTVFETEQGITLPVGWSATFEGQPSKAHSRERCQMKIAKS